MSTRLQIQLQLHHITQRYTTLITLHYTTTETTTTLHYTTLHTTTTTLHYTTIHQTTLTIPRYSTQHYSTLQYTTLITPHPQLQLQLHYTNYTTLQLRLKTTTPLHCNYNYNYIYNYNCTTPQYIQQLWWGDHCNHCSHSRKHNSNHLSVHQWIRSATREWFATTNLSYRCPIFETSATLCGTTGKLYIKTTQPHVVAHRDGFVLVFTALKSSRWAGTEVFGETLNRFSMDGSYTGASHSFADVASKIPRKKCRKVGKTKPACSHSCMSESVVRLHII